MCKEKSFHFLFLWLATIIYGIIWILVGGLWESVIYIIYSLKVWCWVWSSDGWSQPWYWILAAVRGGRRQVVMDPHLSIFTYSPHPDNCIYLSRTEKHPLNGHLYKQCQHDCIIYYITGNMIPTILPVSLHYTLSTLW